MPYIYNSQMAKKKFLPLYHRTVEMNEKKGEIMSDNVQCMPRAMPKSKEV